MRSITFKQYRIVPRHNFYLNKANSLLARRQGAAVAKHCAYNPQEEHSAIMAPVPYKKSAGTRPAHQYKINRTEVSNLDLDSVISKRTKNLALQIIHDDEHFLNSFLEKIPSGRYRSLKYRTAWVKDSFLRHLILILQDVF